MQPEFGGNFHCMCEAGVVIWHERKSDNLTEKMQGLLLRQCVECEAKQEVESEDDESDSLNIYPFNQLSRNYVIAFQSWWVYAFISFQVYVALFKPLRVSRRRFKKILNCLKTVRKLKSQEIYVQEKITKVDSLSLVLTGKWVQVLLTFQKAQSSNFLSLTDL